MKHLKLTLFLSFLFSITACSFGKKLIPRAVSPQIIAIDSTLSEAADIEAIIAPYRAEMSKEMDNVIGILTAELIKTQPESSLGNFCADAILYAARQSSADTVHAAITNYGGMRISGLAAGNITRGNMYELMPFDNRLVVLDLSGEQLTQYLTHLSMAGGWPISDGFQILSDTLAQTLTFSLHDLPIEDSKIYRICTSDYLADGGDDCSFLKDSKREQVGIFFRDGLISYVEMHTAANKSVHSTLQNRFQYVKN